MRRQSSRYAWTKSVFSCPIFFSWTPLIPLRYTSEVYSLPSLSYILLQCCSQPALPILLCLFFIQDEALRQGDRNVVKCLMAEPQLYCLTYTMHGISGHSKVWHAVSLPLVFVVAAAAICTVARRWHITFPFQTISCFSRLFTAVSLHAAVVDSLLFLICSLQLDINKTLWSFQSSSLVSVLSVGTWL